MGNRIQNDFCNVTNQMFRFCNGYTVVVWGCGISGQFVNYIFKRNNKIIDYNLDRNHSVYSLRPYIIKTFNPQYTRIIITFPIDEGIKNYLDGYGFRQGVEYEQLSTLLGKPNVSILGFENWLEAFYDLDITSVPSTGTKKIDAESHNFHWGAHDYKFMEAFDSFIIDDNDAVFDYGCGKGGVMLLLRLRGFNRIGGVEYDDYLYSIAVDNCKKMGMDTNRIIRGDASGLKNEIDEYNYFFLYDPFEGNQFERTINNISDSFERNNRKITIIYASPQCDAIIQKNTDFVLTKRIEANCLEFPGINIYILE